MPPKKKIHDDKINKKIQFLLSLLDENAAKEAQVSLDKLDKPEIKKAPPKKRERTFSKKLIDAYEHDPTQTALQLSKKAGLSVQTAKAYLKVADIKQQPLTKNANEIIHVPCGSDKQGHWQSDIMYMHDYKKQNKGHMAIITLLETTTRVPYARALKSSKAKDVIPALESMLIELKKDGREIKHIRVDNGPEFSNEFKKLMDKNGIEIEFMEPHLSSQLNRTNRLHRSIRGTFVEKFARNKNNHWVEYLQNIMKEMREGDSYAFRETLRNDDISEKKPRGSYTPIAPVDITEKQKKQINDYEKKQALLALSDSLTRLSEGDGVRLLMSHTKAGKTKDKFGKASMTQVWTTKIYRISLNGANTWKIQNLDGSDVKNEIEIWQTYNLKKVSPDDVKRQIIEDTSGKKTNNVNVKAVRALRKEELDISAEEKRGVVIENKTRQSRQSSRVKGKAPVKSNVDPSKLADSTPISFKANHTKKNKSGDRWDIYSKAKTIGQLKTLNPDKFAADFKFDMLNDLMVLN